MKDNRLKNRGFTLIELAMVMVLTGILAAVALPKYMDTGSAASETKATANKQILEQRLKANLAQTVGGYPDAMTLTGGTAGTTGLGSVQYVPTYVSPYVASASGASVNNGTAKATGCSKAGLAPLMSTLPIYAAWWANPANTVYTEVLPVDVTINVGGSPKVIKAGSCRWWDQPWGTLNWAMHPGVPTIPLETTPDVPGDIVMATGNIGFCVAKGRLVRGYTNANGTGAINSGSSVVKSLGPVETAAECDGAT